MRKIFKKSKYILHIDFEILHQAACSKPHFCPNQPQRQDKIPGIFRRFSNAGFAGFHPVFSPENVVLSGLLMFSRNGSEIAPKYVLKSVWLNPPGTHLKNVFRTAFLPRMRRSTLRFGFSLRSLLRTHPTLRKQKN